MRDSLYESALRVDIAEEAETAWVSRSYFSKRQVSLTIAHLQKELTLDPALEPLALAHFHKHFFTL